MLETLVRSENTHVISMADLLFCLLGFSGLALVVSCLVSPTVILPFRNKYYLVTFFLNGPIPASFCLFSFFSHHNSNLN